MLVLFHYLDTGKVMVDGGAFNTTVVMGGNTTLQCTVTTDRTPEISVSSVKEALRCIEL